MMALEAPALAGEAMAVPALPTAAAAAASSTTTTRWSPVTRELVAGMFAGAVNVTSGFPFDTVKVRLQQQAGGSSSSSMGQVARDLWRTEGARGFFRGLSPPLIGGAAETGVNYLVYCRVLAMFPAPQHQHQQALPPLSAVPLAGAVAGVALSPILSPVELLKCRMQVAGSQHASPLACLRHVLRSEGAGGLARGFRATLVREVPGNCIFFSTYEALRRQMPGARGGSHGGSSSSNDGGSSLLSVAADAAGAVLAGGVAGVAMWTAVLPLDVAKTRIQTAQPGGSWDTGVAQQLRALWREGGRRALWAGLTPTLLRAFPANAAQFVAWELAMRRLLPPADEQSQ